MAYFLSLVTNPSRSIRSGNLLKNHDRPIASPHPSQLLGMANIVVISDMKLWDRENLGRERSSSATIGDMFIQ